MYPGSFTAVIALLCFCCSHCARKRIGTCPELELCACKTTGPFVTCSSVNNETPVLQDIARLQGHVIRKLYVSHVSVAALPAYLFSNITLRVLQIRHCGLTSLDDNAFVGITEGRLSDLHLTHNLLTTVPRALGALSELSGLYLDYNRIQHVDQRLGHLPSLRVLSLSHNLISSFHPNAFKNLRSLRKLWLGTNRIKTIPPRLLSGVPALAVLSLRNNSISSLTKAMFQNLNYLQELTLSNNNISNIYGVTAVPLTSLKKLFLNDNPITGVTAFGAFQVNVEVLTLRNCNISLINPVAFVTVEQLRTLHISYNNIPYVNGSAFHKISRLVTLLASHNSITSLEETFHYTRMLEKVHMSSNKITDISNAFSVTKYLKELKLAKNLISFLADGTFENNGNLEQLDFGHNRIAWLGRYCFHRLVSLKHLFLEGNRLIMLNGSLHSMPTLQLLYIQRNLLGALEDDDFSGAPRLKMIYAFANNISDVRGAFKELPRLEKLLLQNNSLTTIHRASFPTASMSLKIINIAGNPLHCDCQISWLLEDRTGVSLQGIPLCDTPFWWQGSSLRNLTLEDLQHWPEDCDHRCTCTCHVNEDYSRVTNVDCSNRGLTHIPERVPRDTHLINLGQNQLRATGSFFVERTPYLHTLLLRDNSLANIEAMHIPRGLKLLDLRNNSLTRLPTPVASQLNLSRLWLSGNPWSCGCEAYDFQVWARVHEDVVRDSIICAEGSNPSVSQKPLMLLDSVDFCPPDISEFVTFGVPVFVLLTIVLTVTVVYVKRERQIKIWLYSHGVHFVKEYELDSDKVFDVFISFSSKDYDWAYANLIPGLERAGFSLCTYDRNFKGGFLLQDIIREAVSCSRRTLLLLTQ
ncbi:protein toll-like isoform X2 [Ornithodoros turicata]